jgi:hypothetical protein
MFALFIIEECSFMKKCHLPTNTNIPTSKISTKGNSNKLVVRTVTFAMFPHLAEI